MTDLPSPKRSWREDAACIGTPTAMFFPNEPPWTSSSEVRARTEDRYRDTAAPALALCHRCPVRRPCLDDALTMPVQKDHGIRGGMTPRGRRAERVRRSQR